jgi:nucleoside-diphosphate-sugar epimerase
MSEGNEKLHVIFGTGPVGLAIMDELVTRNQRIRLVNRRGLAQAPDSVEVVAGDASDPLVTRKLCDGADIVYNCTNPPYTKWPELFPPLQAGVLEGAAAAGAKLVAMENLYMYGETNGKPMTENFPNAATTRKGQVRATMTADLMAAHEAGKVRVTIGRASDFFGPRALISAMGERVFYPALAGKAAQIVGDPDMPHTQTYVPDIGKALVTLGEHDEALGQVWHIPSPETVTTRQFLQLVFDETGNQLKIQVMPGWLLKVLSMFNPMLRELNEMLYEFEEPFIVDDSKFTNAFDIHATPLHEAIKTTVAWYRQNPRQAA